MRLILESRVDPEERSRTLTGYDLELSNVQEEPGQAYFEVWLPSFEAGPSPLLRRQGGAGLGGAASPVVPDPDGRGHPRTRPACR